MKLNCYSMLMFGIEKVIFLNVSLLVKGSINQTTVIPTYPTAN